MIFLHTGLPHCTSWDTIFEKYLIDQHLDYKKINLNDALDENAGKNDFLIGRINEFHNIDDNYYKKLSKKYGKIWPTYNSFWYYNNKKRQYDLFKKNKYPMPESFFAKDHNDLKDCSLCFPLVQKKIYGSSGKNVSLAKTKKEINYPCLLQKFCPNNDSDLRIVNIGGKIFGLQRMVGKNCFKASGSKIFREIKELPKKCIYWSIKICKENDFDVMCFDFIKEDNEWTIVEMSYTFGIENSMDFVPFYFDTILNKKVYTKIVPEKMVIQNIFKKNIEIKFL